MAGADDLGDPTREPIDVVPAIPAATVVLARDAATSDGGTTIEVLLLRRNSKLSFAGGMWVFPGGRVDEADRDAALATGVGPARDNDEAGARFAAVREAAEEAGVALTVDDLVWFSHWTPPTISPKRFATWFFVVRAPDDPTDVTIDGGEIHDHGWMAPGWALERCNAGEIELSPPTWISLEYLSCFATVDALLADARRRDPEHFATRIAALDDALVALYDGDAGYDASDPGAEGGRHRLVMAPGTWRYERDGWPPADLSPG